MADINGLLNDPDFQKLDTPTQKATLSAIDSDFSGISDSDFAAFKDAKSVGRYFGENIRGRFAHERIEEEKEPEA